MLQIELNISPGNCVVFEDAVAGIQAARNGGMTCFGIGSDKILHEADLVVKSLKEMTLEIKKQENIWLMNQVSLKRF
ncbi:hypothetical protein ES705_19392 [subsurface metagenome]